MRILMTGANGTVGQSLRQHWETLGATVVAWDRNRVPISSYAVMEDYVRAVAPDVLYHLAIASQLTGRPDETWAVNYEWTSELAWITRVLGVQFVFTSTAMVFSDHALGPFSIVAEPDAATGYGYEKRQAEARVFYQNPQARVVRLGWQIGEAPGSNNMIDFFDRQQQAQGRVVASTRWLPACSFLADTATALATLAHYAPGLYHLDSNRGWNFFQIATAIKQAAGGAWNIEASEDFVFDQRLLDEHPLMPTLKEHLPQLPVLK